MQNIILLTLQVIVNLNSAFLFNHGSKKMLQPWSEVLRHLTFSATNYLCDRLSLPTSNRDSVNA